MDPTVAAAKRWREAECPAKCACWRARNANRPRQTSTPVTLQSLQDAWQRDQEVISDLQQEIAALKHTINKLRQHLDARSGASDSGGGFLPVVKG